MKSLTIHGEGVLIDNAAASAEQIDDLLRQLGMMRSKLQPAVPRVSAQPGQEQFDLEFEPAIEISRTTDGSIYLALRHSGFGWMRFVLPPRQARFLHAGLGKRLDGVETLESIDADVTGGHRSH